MSRLEKAILLKELLIKAEGGMFPTPDSGDDAPLSHIEVKPAQPGIKAPPGYAAKEVIVHRKGKTFKSTRFIKIGEAPNKEGVVLKPPQTGHVKIKPEANKNVDDYGEIAPYPVQEVGAGKAKPEEAKGEAWAKDAKKLYEEGKKKQPEYTPEEAGGKPKSEGKMDNLWNRTDELRNLVMDVIGGCKDANAIAYGHALLNNPDTPHGMMKGHDLIIQLVYMRTNMSHWKGEEGKAARAQVDAWIKGLQAGQEPPKVVKGAVAGKAMDVGVDWNVKPPKQQWTTIGKKWNDTPEKKKAIQKAVKEIDWVKTEGNPNIKLPMMPGEGIKKVIATFHIPKVSALGWVSLPGYQAFGNRALLAVEGNYHNGRARIYVMDAGDELIPVYMEHWDNGQ